MPRTHLPQQQPRQRERFQYVCRVDAAQRWSGGRRTQGEHDPTLCTEPTAAAPCRCTTHLRPSFANTSTVASYTSAARRNRRRADASNGHSMPGGGGTGVPASSRAASLPPALCPRRLRLLRRARDGLRDKTPRPPLRPFFARRVSSSTALRAASARRSAACVAADRTVELIRSTWCSMDGACANVGRAPSTRLVLSTTGTAPGSTLSTSLPPSPRVAWGV